MTAATSSPIIADTDELIAAATADAATCTVSNSIHCYFHFPPLLNRCSFFGMIPQLSYLEEKFKEATGRMMEAEQRVKEEVINGNKFADENDVLRQRCALFLSQLDAV